MTSDIIAVIPVAGVGTRLRPHTHTLPKVLLHVAGKPILAHILDDLPGLGIRRAVLIVGYMGDLVREYVGAHYQNLEVDLRRAARADGPGARGLAGRALRRRRARADHPRRHDLRGRPRQPVLAGGVNSIGVKEVQDPRRFGIVEPGPTAA